VLSKLYLLENSTTIVPKKVEGSKIEWNPGKDVTMNEVKKKVKSGKGPARTVTRLEPVESFFNFFNPPAVRALLHETGLLPSSCRCSFRTCALR
jgi:nucleosome assembly protein 1-like 1